MTTSLLITVAILCAILLILLLAVLWKLSQGHADGSQTILRELLENLRRELTDTKDKLHDQLGKNTSNIQERLEKTIELVNKQLGGMDTRLDKRMGDINARLDAAAKLMGTVQKQYGTVEEISREVRTLQEAFKSPKPRGSLSEKLLLDLAQQVLPSQRIHAQYPFKTGSIVDLMIETSQGKLCIDAKFPLENYLRMTEEPENAEWKKAFSNDVKKHIRDVAKKYILPEEGTLPIAYLYVPSDAVMYEILLTPELTDLAEGLHITILSPHTFHAFLTILYGSYQSQVFAENAKQVLALIRGIQVQSSKLGSELDTLQHHLQNATNKMGDAYGEHTKLALQIAQAGQLEDAKPIAKLG